MGSVLIPYKREKTIRYFIGTSTTALVSSVIGAFFYIGKIRSHPSDEVVRRKNHERSIFVTNLIRNPSYEDEVVSYRQNFLCVITICKVCVFVRGKFIIGTMYILELYYVVLRW